MGVNKFIRYEDIQYFVYKIRKGHFFLSQAMKNVRKDHAAKLLNKFDHAHQPNMLDFFQMRTVSTRIRW